MITTKDRIGLIQRRYDEQGVPHFKLIHSKVKKVVIGAKKTSVYSDRFYTLDAEELESNTSFINKENGFLIVGETFILKEEDIPYYEEVCKRWNENPPKSIWE